MKFTFHYIVIVLLLLTVICNGQSNNDVLLKRVTIDSDSLSRSQLFAQISTQTGAYFSYNPDLLNANEIVSAHYTDEELAAVLTSVIDNNDIAFKSIEKQIVLYSKKQTIEETSKLQIRTIQGSLIDREQKEALPYCNITIVGKAIGTISNLDGRFALKINENYLEDTLMISCIGFYTLFVPIQSFSKSDTTIVMTRSSIMIKEVDVLHKNPLKLIEEMIQKIPENYELENTLYTTFYRETIKEDDQYSEVTEAVLQIIKAPYDNENMNDIVRFLKGRKTKSFSSNDSIRFRLKGGPFYITKLDIVKNSESFIDPMYRSVYNFYFDKEIFLNDRETWVVDFRPIRAVSEILYTGTLYIDATTSALSRVDFQLTRQGLKEAGKILIEKTPKHFKATPTELKYSVQYKIVGNKWYFQTAQSTISVRLNDRENNVKSNFVGISEILTTDVEKGDIPNFIWKEVFKPFDFVTDKIKGFDHDFWENYNVILPEDELSKVFKNFKVETNNVEKAVSKSK